MFVKESKKPSSDCLEEYFLLCIILFIIKPECDGILYPIINPGTATILLHNSPRLGPYSFSNTITYERNVAESSGS